MEENIRDARFLVQVETTFCSTAHLLSMVYYGCFFQNLEETPHANRYISAVSPMGTSHISMSV